MEQDIENRKLELEERRFKEEIQLKNRELDLRDKEIKIREKEVDLQQKQFEVGQNVKGVWSQVFSPVGVAVIVGLLGLIGTAIGGLLNVKIEREKQEASLVLKMSEIADDKRRASNLLFFAQVGYLNFDEKRIEALRKQAGLNPGDQAPPPSVAPTTVVDIPKNINEGLSQVPTSTLKRLFGSSETCSQEYGFISNPNIQSLIVTEDVGPFKAKGFKPAIDALRRILIEVQKQEPDLYAQIKNGGMLICPLPSRSVPTRHAFGIAIDILFGKDFIAPPSGKTQSGLARIYPYFNKEKFFWLAEGRAGDTFHFEASNELIQEWEQSGIFNQ